jgi:O-antigen/teichoic acid export membrane protein
MPVQFTLNVSRIRRLAKEGSWIVIGQIALVAGALVLVRVLTEYLNPAQYGQLALGLTVAGLVNQVVMGGITAGIGRFYSIAAEKQDLHGYLRDSRRLLGYGVLAVAAIGLVLMVGLLWLGYSHWIGLAAAALVFSVISAFNSSLSGIQNAARQRAIVAFHGGLDAWLKILLVVGVMLWLGTSSTAVVIGYTCSSLLVTVSQLFFLRRTIPPQHTSTANHQPWMSQMWAYSWPFSAWGIFTWMQQVSDRWALAAFATTEEVGRYAVLFQLGYASISMVTGLAMAFLGPILYQRSGDATDHARNAHVHRLGWQLTYVCLMATGTGFVITFTMHEWIFRLLVAAQYRQISYLLPWIVLAGGLFAAGQMLALKLMSEMKSAKMASAKITTALLGLAFNIYGASVAGLSGVVGALIAFSAIYLAWMIWLARHCRFTR